MKAEIDYFQLCLTTPESLDRSYSSIEALEEDLGLFPYNEHSRGAKDAIEEQMRTDESLPAGIGSFLKLASIVSAGSPRITIFVCSRLLEIIEGKYCQLMTQNKEETLNPDDLENFNEFMNWIRGRIRELLLSTTELKAGETILYH